MNHGLLRQFLAVSMRAVAVASLACLPSVAAASTEEGWSFPSPGKATDPVWPEPISTVLEASEWGGYSCMLVWEYNLQSRVMVTRLAEGKLRILFWRDDKPIGAIKEPEAVFAANGQTFTERASIKSSSPLFLSSEYGGGGVEIEVDKAFLRAFAAGQKATFSIDGKTGSAFDLLGTAAARRTFNACKDPSGPPALIGVPSPPPISMSPAPAPPPPPILFTPPPAPVPEAAAREVSPRNLQRWANRIAENYPASALRQELEGIVGVTVVVNSVGRVSNCSVFESSGHQVLDDAACKGMVRYARFNPALNNNGDPIESLYSIKFTYEIPEPAPVEPVAPEGGSQPPG